MSLGLTVRRQVHAGIDGEEVVALALAAVLGGELQGADLDLLPRCLADLLLLFSVHFSIAVYLIKI